MIDKVDLRIPGTANWGRGIRLVAGAIHFQGRSVSVRGSRYYQGVADLRGLGLDALLHVHYRFNWKHEHKLELLETGKKSLGDMAEIVSTIFDLELGKLLLIRLDLAADIPDVPVEYLRRCFRVMRKRKTDERGVIEYEDIGDRRVQYLRFGKSPNLIRIYDKVAERQACFVKILKRANPDSEMPTFEEIFGHPDNATLTRIERQMGGGRIPRELTTFGSLKNAANFDPFTEVEIIHHGIPIPDSSVYSPSETVKILGIDAMIAREGYQNAFARLNQDHNAKRLMEPYDRFALVYGPTQKIDRMQVTESFRQSVTRQLEGDAKPKSNNQASSRQEEPTWPASMR